MVPSHRRLCGMFSDRHVGNKVSDPSLHRSRSRPRRRCPPSRTKEASCSPVLTSDTVSTKTALYQASTRLHRSSERKDSCPSNLSLPSRVSPLSGIGSSSRFSNAWVCGRCLATLSVSSCNLLVWFWVPCRRTRLDSFSNSCDVEQCVLITTSTKVPNVCTTM